MLKLSAPLLSAFEAQALERYAQRLGTWLATQGLPGGRQLQVDGEWVRSAIAFGRHHGITDEADVAELSYLMLVEGRDWFDGEAAREILQSHRDGGLKVFQLRCLSGREVAVGK